MKNLVNIKNTFILGLIIILSCSEKDPVSPSVDFDYTISLTTSTTNETYYADGCSNCTDYNPIIFIATLESSSATVKDKDITFSYSSSDITEVIQPFDNESQKTDNSGRAQAEYDDNGFSGEVTIEASFTESVGFGDSIITASYTVALEPYYLKVSTVAMYVTSSGITAGDLNSNTSISFFVTDENNIGLPNMPVLFSKNSSVGTFYSNTNPFNAEQARTDAQGVASVNFSIADASVSDDSIIISATVDDNNIEDPTGFTSSTTITIVPLDIPQYTLTLDRISEGEAILVDGETSYLFYSDLDAKSIIYQATLRDGDNAVQGRNINFSYTNMDGSAITNAYFQSIDLTTQSNGTFKIDYNDGGENGSVIITANFSDTQYSVSISKSDNLTITPYYEAVATVSGWTDDPEIISGIDAATTESTRIWTQVLDVNGLPLKNVQIVFGVNESSDNIQPNIGSFITDFISYTDNAGKAYVDYEAFPNTPGGELNVTIDIVGDPDESNENHKEILIKVNEPKFDYCLLLESAEGINYSDLNNTTTLFESTLLNVFCAEGITSTVCCADPVVIGDGDPVANQSLQIDFTNDEHSVPLGEIQLIDPITDSNGKMKFEFLDNGETGVIDVTVSYTDIFGNSPDNTTHSFTVLPVEQLVENVHLTSDPAEIVIITDTTVVYETIFTTLISDDNGASVPNVNVEFYNDWSNGTLSSPNCVTSENGICDVTLYSTQSDFGIAEVIACVEFEELARAFQESNGELKFSWIEEAQLIQSTKSKGKNRKSKNTHNFTLNISNFKNSQSYQTYSSDNHFCTNTNSVSASHSVEYIEEEQFYINQVAEIDVWVIAEEVIEDNINVTVIDTIFVRALNYAGQGVQNVPVQFNKITGGFGYISSSEAITDSTGLAMTIYYPNTESYSGSEDTVDISFTIGVAGSDTVEDVNQQITLDTSGNVNVELDVAYFDFYPNLTDVSHIMGNETSISVIAKDANGVGMANVPIYFSLSSATAPCQGVAGCENNSTNLDCSNAGCTWDLISPSGILSNFLVPTCCNDEGSSDDGSAETADTTAVTQPGVARISYWNSEGLSDKLTAYIKHPLDANIILFQDEVSITTNITTDLITWSQHSTVSVTSLDSLYCDSLFVTAIDANGNTLADIPVTFNLDDNVDGYINVINPQTGSNGSPATALFCPVQGFVGYCEGGDGCSDYATTDDCSDDLSSIGGCSWDNQVDIAISTSVANVDNSTISITYLDATPECPECIAELKLEADDFILPSEISGTCTGSSEGNTCSLNSTEETCSVDITTCSWDGSGSTWITATMIDSLGYGPEDNIHIFYQAIQLVPEIDNPDNLVWEPVGSIPEIDYFLNDTSKVLFNMENASGLIAIVGNAEALTDTIYLQLKSTTPSYIEIFDPYPSNIMVQGGGGQASTDVNVAIRDANGSNVDKPFWVKFTIIGAPNGVHINGESGVVSVNQLTLNGESSISINAGTAPGTVRIKVELYEDNSGVMGTAVSDVPTEEKNIVTVITGPPAQGEINYSYVDIVAIGGGIYEVPVTVMLWDVHSNPVSDSTNVYFDVRGITDVYDTDETYFNGDIIYWGLDTDADSLIYKCVNTDDIVCSFGDITLVSNPYNPIYFGNSPDPGGNVPNIWVEQIHPASIEGGAKTGNENVEGDSYTGVANTMLRFGSSSIFSETIIRANTLGANGETLTIDSRASHAGESLVLPLTPDGSLSVQANPLAWDFSVLGTPAPVTVTATLTDYYQYFIDNGTLGISAPFATIISSCNAIDSDGDGITGVCFDDLNGDGFFDDNEFSLPFLNTCSVCGNEGGAWQFSDKDFGENVTTSTCTFAGGTWYGDAIDDVAGDGLGWCGDGIADDNPVFGITNSGGQVSWSIRYDVGINTCDDCEDAQNPTCEDRESNLIVQLMDPLSQAADPVIIVISRTDHCNDGL